MIDFQFQNRREFLKYTAGCGLMLYGLNTDAHNEFLSNKELTELQILYTNDQHSRIEPFPSNDAKYPNEGGFAKRASIIEKYRNNFKNVLLLDAGDIFQGTPYFNFYQGEIEYKLMSLMGYDATTFGNHDFDLGVENILKQMPHANFDFINSNYNFSDTALNKNTKIKPYKIFKKQNLKIGVYGVGIELNGLVSENNCKNIQYLNPINEANKIEHILKHDEKCDYIICLSHLGYKYESNKVSDTELAKKTNYTNLIIGGHTHTFLENLVEIENLSKNITYITQVGWAGIWLGSIKVTFTTNKKIFLQNNTNHKVF
ncbi:MAG: metallophosphatase [Bacteroidetes bacterium]|nr:metallophosphatase [Bacteroidota bacterium]